MSVQEIKTLLKQSGLTEYEARACLALIRLGKCSAEKISSTEGVPLPRVYDTMSSLSKRGLISVSRTRPQLFTITDFKRFFNILKSDEKRKFEKKVKEIDNISSKFFKTISSMPKAKGRADKDDISLTFTKRRINIGEVWEQVQNETKKEFLVFAGDLSWIDFRAKDIKKLVNKGIKYKILWAKCVKDVVPNVKKVLRTKAELRCYDNYDSKLRCIISDGKKVYLIRKTQKPDVNVNIRDGLHWSEEFANYTGIMLTSKLIAKVFRDYFYLLWEKSLPADKFLQKFKR